MSHPSQLLDTSQESQLRHALWLIRVYARQNGHALGRATDGCAECRNCGALMVDSDALGYFKGADESILGSFHNACPLS